MTATACAEPGCTGADPRRLLRRVRVPGPASAAPQRDASGLLGRRRARRARRHRCSQPAAPARSSTGTATSADRRAAGRPPPRSGAGGPSALGLDGWRRPASPSTVSCVRRAGRAGSARAAGGGSRVTRRVGTSSTAAARARLGAGLTVDPAGARGRRREAVLKDPTVPEDKRFCSDVRHAGRPLAATASPGGPRASARSAGSPFSFTPKLQAGRPGRRPVRGRGRLAHGGLGWIYLARDRNVSDRWVVLKGLLNSGDPDALAAAIAEQQFLAQVEHPLIVEIYNFVTHEGAGYIVMEYVGGTRSSRSSSSG